MNTRAFTWKLFVLLALLAPGVADARPPMSREWRGTVAAVDTATQTLTVADTRQRPLTVRWNERTRFVAGAQFTTADAMRRGTEVEVRYRSPFFGEPYASKVILLSTATPQTKPNNP